MKAYNRFESRLDLRVFLPVANYIYNYITVKRD